MGTRCESHRKEGLLSTPTNQKKRYVMYVDGMLCMWMVCYVCGWYDMYVDVILYVCGWYVMYVDGMLCMWMVCYVYGWHVMYVDGMSCMWMVCHVCG